ncbi:hypothetical protein [Devosia sp.]|uniref:hypothetical protein n=1 Tax=Devosia sp. TaxID=1871048 RepID=UPI001A0F5E3E|nr:hypothetical protein [Devosia sp.]MBE0581633.1 hypothetical protein [Devosia sp.]
MAQPTTTFLDELLAAARGCVALVLGRREAASYFDFSQRGLVGSLIATVIAIGLAGFGPLLTGIPLPAGAATQSIIVNAALFLAQAATAFIALRQMGRQDGFIPYLVASNWVTLASALLLLLSTLLGPTGIIVLVLVVVVALATFINIGRFIVTLTPVQIGILFVSQAVGVFLALAVVAIIFGAPPA